MKWNKIHKSSLQTISASTNTDIACLKLKMLRRKEDLATTEANCENQFEMENIQKCILRNFIKVKIH